MKTATRLITVAFLGFLLSGCMVHFAVRNKADVGWKGVEFENRIEGRIVW